MPSQFANILKAIEKRKQERAQASTASTPSTSCFSSSPVQAARHAAQVECSQPASSPRNPQPTAPQMPNCENCGVPAQLQCGVCTELFFCDTPACYDACHTRPHDRETHRASVTPLCATTTDIPPTALPASTPHTHSPPFSHLPPTAQHSTAHITDRPPAHDVPATNPPTSASTPHEKDAADLTSTSEEWLDTVSPIGLPEKTLEAEDQGDWWDDTPTKPQAEPPQENDEWPDDSQTTSAKHDEWPEDASTDTEREWYGEEPEDTATPGGKSEEHVDTAPPLPPPPPLRENETVRFFEFHHLGDHNGFMRWAGPSHQVHLEGTSQVSASFVPSQEGGFCTAINSRFATESLSLQKTHVSPGIFIRFPEGVSFCLMQIALQFIGDFVGPLTVTVEMKGKETIQVLQRDEAIENERRTVYRVKGGGAYVDGVRITLLGHNVGKGEATMAVTELYGYGAKAVSVVPGTMAQTFETIECPFDSVLSHERNHGVITQVQGDGRSGQFVCPVRAKQVRVITRPGSKMVGDPAEFVSPYVNHEHVFYTRPGGMGFFSLFFSLPKSVTIVRNLLTLLM